MRRVLFAKSLKQLKTMTNLFKQFLAIGALFFIVTSCDKNALEIDPSAEQLQMEIPTDDTDAHLEASYEVAKIKKDGNEYIFEAVGEENEMVMLIKVSEFAEENDEVYRIAESDNPFEAFIALTDDNVKIPLSIAKTVDESLVAASKREISESSSSLEILDTNDNTKASSRGCYDVGATNFKKQYCRSDYWIASSNDIRYCDQWKKSGRQIRSAKGIKKIRTWTNVICGPTKIYLTTYDRYSGFYVKNYEKSLSNGIWWVNRYYSTAKHRGVTRWSYSGTHRAFTRFTTY